jgi:hypothetical protein
MHPFLSDQLATARLAEIHAEAMRRRTIRDVAPGRGWRFWRRPRPGPPPRVVVAIPRRIDHVDVPETTLRPVA